VEEARRFDERRLSEDAKNKMAPRNQVTVFGFACDHSPTLLPFPIWMAHRLARQLTEARRGGLLPHLTPDGRVQVGVEFHDRRPARIHSVTLQADQKPFSQAHGDEDLEQAIRELVIAPAFAGVDVQPDPRTRIDVNPEGPYLGGPAHHSGLTGRKSAIDTYGEFSRHSGKALSGKDPMRIDRIGAYAARYAAKNMVAAGLARECEVMLSYTAGVAGPVSAVVQTFGTGTLSDENLTSVLLQCFDFRFASILGQFDLRRLPGRYPAGFYQKLAAYGHFGRTDLELPWERTDKVELLKDRTR